MNVADGGHSIPADAASSTANKAKRVRTGCLTCRERHLKCDEGLPTCQNCRKSSRICKRGVRLNFIDTQVQSPPIVQTSADWAVQFQDESREIASEYKGGLSRYAHIDQTITPPIDQTFDFPLYPLRNRAQVHQPSMINALPPIHPGLTVPYPEGGLPIKEEHCRCSSHSLQNVTHHSQSTSEASYLPPPPASSYSNPEQILTPPTETRDYLNSPEEVLFMQVFVEEVGLWMDSMDPMKHFSRLLPFDSLGEPMLLNAFLACGARHLTLVNPAYHEDKALHYYDTATTQLLRALQNPDRDTVICATSAVILNVYEIMSERALQRMNHIAGARALIKECGWSAKSVGIGGACFWLNVTMELLSCLHFNWQVAWDPDQWGVDMDFQRETETGREETWVYRMVYILAKIANLRASIPRFQEPSPHDEQIRMQNRYSEWQRLKTLCDNWNDSIPRTMHPMAYLHPHQTASKSAFPEVWLIKRATVVGRLFYHTAMTLLPQINPFEPASSLAMHEMALQHAHQICGIVAHVKDRGVASVAIRSIAIACELLKERHEQEEVLQVIEKIRKETGWRIGFLLNDLKEKWGWNDGVREEQAHGTDQMLLQGHQQSSLSHFFSPGLVGSGSPLPAAQPPSTSASIPRAAYPGGGNILNPLLKADFSLPNHPYQHHYQPPSQHNNYAHTYF